MIKLYLKELFFLFIYIFTSFILCFSVSIFKYHSLILYSSFIILKVFKKKLFIFNIFDILNVVSIIILFYIFYFLWFLFIYLCFNFMKASFYKTQKKIFHRLINFFINLHFVYFLFINFLVIYIFIYTFLYWNINFELNSFNLFNIQITFYNYVLVWIKINSNILFFFDNFFLCFIFLGLFFSFIKIYLFLKRNKKYIFYFISLILFFLFDNFIFYGFCLFIFIEFFYLFLCYKIFFYFDFL